MQPSSAHFLRPPPQTRDQRYATLLHHLTSSPPTAFPASTPSASRPPALFLKIKPEDERSDHKTREEISRMEPGARRRYERNQREKLRSFRISKQIKDLQTVLTALQIPYKNNKFSVLVSAVSFIRDVQRENEQLRGLVSSLKMIYERAEAMRDDDSDTNSAGQAPSVPPSPPPSPPPESTDFLRSLGPTTVDHMLIFDSNPTPMALALAGGGEGIVRCNAAFIRVVGMDESEVRKRRVSELVVDVEGGGKRMRTDKGEEVDVRTVGKVVSLAVRVVA